MRLTGSDSANTTVVVMQFSAVREQPYAPYPVQQDEAERPQRFSPLVQRRDIRAVDVERQHAAPT